MSVRQVSLALRSPLLSAPSYLSISPPPYPSPTSPISPSTSQRLPLVYLRRMFAPSLSLCLRRYSYVPADLVYRPAWLRWIYTRPRCVPTPRTCERALLFGLMPAWYRSYSAGPSPKKTLENLGHGGAVCTIVPRYHGASRVLRAQRISAALLLALGRFLQPCCARLLRHGFVFLYVRRFLFAFVAPRYNVSRWRCYF